MPILKPILKPVLSQILKQLLGAGDECQFYTFNLGGALGDKLTLDAGALVSGVLFSTLNGSTGLNPVFAGAYTNAASDSPADLAATFHQVGIAETALNYICDETFSGVVWAYRVNGVWIRVDMGEPESTLRWFYQLNGTTSYIVQADEIAISPSTQIAMSFRRFSKVTQYERFFGSASFNVSIDAGINGDKFRLVGGTATLDGSPIVSDVTLIPTDDVNHDIVFTPTVNATITRFGDVSGAGATRRLNATLYNIKIGDGSLHHYSVNGGPLGGSVVVNNGSGGNASIAGYSALAWYEGEQ